MYIFGSGTGRKSHTYFVKPVQVQSGPHRVLLSLVVPSGESVQSSHPDAPVPVAKRRNILSS